MAITGLSDIINFQDDDKNFASPQDTYGPNSLTSYGINFTRGASWSASSGVTATSHTFIRPVASGRDVLSYIALHATQNGSGCLSIEDKLMNFFITANEPLNLEFDPVITGSGLAQDIEVQVDLDSSGDILFNMGGYQEFIQDPRLNEGTR